MARSRLLQLSRRDFLRAGAAGGLILTTSWLWDKHVRAQETPTSADDDRKTEATARKCKHVILLYMEGGPSQLETFDPKPGQKTGAPFKALSTEVPGFTPVENLPLIAKAAPDLCLIKTLSSKEGNHSRASYLMHTGYAPNPTLRHPSLGSIISHQMGLEDFDLPNFVKLRGGPFPAGYLGTAHNPFVISKPGSKIENLDYARGVDKKRMDRRMKLVEEMEDDFAKEHGEEATEAHAAMYEKAQRLMDSPLRSRFYLEDEPSETRKLYGEGTFADSCIIARRLIESGVSCVEVVLGGWDTHDDGFNRTKNLCTELDKPWAALIQDLKKRGLYEETMVIWMGEFGRTPRLTNTDGRGHWPGNFCVLLGGGGVKAGQVIGETSQSGEEIAKDPVTPAELYRTLGAMMNWDMKREFEAGNRPIWLVDKEAKPIERIYS